jgi:hypothetical protein
MKSQNDIFHGDENTTDKPKKYNVVLHRVVTYEVEIEAMDEDQASIDAHNLLVDTYDLEQYEARLSWFEVDDVEEVHEAPPQNYNYTYGYGGTD